MSCIFCNIRDNKAPSYKVYEDQQTLAFLDINPVAEGHVLLIPGNTSSTSRNSPHRSGKHS